MIKDILRGSLTAVASALPAAIIVGILYKFPIPFAGEASGFEILKVFTELPFLWFIYGILAVSPVMIIGGTITSIVIRKKVTDQAKRKKYIYLAGIAVAFVFAFFLAILDKIIGPW